jgi:DNA (cytosine-5)-methyltransferase 1
LTENKEKNNYCEKNWKLVNFCEFDKYATSSYCAIHNENESKNLGDITKVDETKLEPFNMICGGSPCQDFSVAGKQKGSVWTCKDCEHEYNPLTVHWSERDKCPCCGSNNIEKTRSSLLVEYLRVIRANKPNFGMYENVKNIVGKQFKDTFKMFTDELDEYGYNVYWKVLNAKDYGIPQNRERVYLIFIKKELDNGKFTYPEPFDNGMRLKDILEENVDEKFYISEDKVQRFIQTLHIDKSDEGSNTPKFVGNVNRPDFGTGYAGGVWDANNISPTLTTMQGGGRQPHIMQGIDKSYNNTKQIEIANCLTAREDRGISNRKSEGTAVLEVGRTDNHQKGGVYSTDGISPTLLATSYKQPVQIKVDNIGNINPSGKGMNGNVFDENGLAPTLTTNKGEGNKIAIHEVNQEDNNKPKERFFRQALETFENSNANYGDTIDAFNKRVNRSGYSPTLTTRPEGFKTAILPVTNDIRIRKLTPKECFRLMGFSDENFEAAEKIVSNSQLYKQAGNSIVVDVLYYILVELYKAMPYLFDDLRLSSFFSGIGAFEIALNRLYEGINSGNFINPQAD